MEKCSYQLAKNNCKIMMLRFGKIKLEKEEFHGAKKTAKMWDVNVNNTVISKLVEAKNNSKYLIEYLDDIIRSLVLMLSKISGYVKRFKDNSNNKLLSLQKDYDKLLE